MSSRRPTSSARGKRRKRRSFKDTSLLWSVIGSVLVGIALVFLILGLTCRNNADQRTARLHMSIAGWVAAFTVFVLRSAFLYWAERKRQRRIDHPFNRPNGSGAALILVLIVLSSLTALALQLADLGVTFRIKNHRALIRENLKAAAWMGLLQGAQQLADDEDLRVDPAAEKWMEGDWTHPSGLHVVLRILDAQRRMDLNTLAALRTDFPSAAAERIETVLRSSGIANAADWMARLRTSAIDEATPLGSGKTERTGRPFQGWDHIREVVGPERFDGDLLAESAKQSLFEVLTVLPLLREQPNRVNLNSAPEPVLRALSGPSGDAWARTLLTLREASPLRSQAVLNELRGETPFRRIQDLIDVRSDYFHILATAEQGAEQVRLSALFFREADGTCRPVRWGQCP